MNNRKRHDIMKITKAKWTEIEAIAYRNFGRELMPGVIPKTKEQFETEMYRFVWSRQCELEAIEDEVRREVSLLMGW